jgi:hypothetical protein
VDPTFDVVHVDTKHSSDKGKRFKFQYAESMFPEFCELEYDVYPLNKLKMVCNRVQYTKIFKNNSQGCVLLILPNTSHVHGHHQFDHLLLPMPINGNFSLLFAFLSSAFCPSSPITSRFERRKNGMSEAECSSECTIKDDVNKPKEQQATK